MSDKAKEFWIEPDCEIIFSEEVVKKHNIDTSIFLHVIEYSAFEKIRNFLKDTLLEKANGMKITIILTQEETEGLRNHLGGLIGKGSMSTTPSWAKRICGKIDMARYEAKQRENRQCSECGGYEADNGIDDICDCSPEDDDTGDLCRFGR